MKKISIDNKYRLYITKNEEDYYGKRFFKSEIKCRICPECNKVELYIIPNK